MTLNDLNIFYKSVSFAQDSDGFFVGIGQNSRDGLLFKFAIFEEKICCFKNELLIFQIPLNIDFGTFIVLCQDFGVIHKRFIYEHVEAVEEEFRENEIENNESEDEPIEEDEFLGFDDEIDDRDVPNPSLPWNSPEKQYLKTTKFYKDIKKGNKRKL
jgi:hypothetical protein